MKGLLLLSDNVEDVEALATRALLIRSGFTITTASLNQTKQITTAFGLSFEADELYDHLDISSYDLLIIPGGKYVANTIDNSSIPMIAKTFYDQDKVIAAICAGPRFLGKAGLLNGLQYTAFPGSENDSPKGIYLPDYKAHTDGKVITAKGAGTVYDFVYQIIQYFQSKEHADQLLKSIHNT